MAALASSATALQGTEARASMRCLAQVLAKSVDEQLQPLAELVEQMGGCPCAVLLQVAMPAPGRFVLLLADERGGAQQGSCGSSQLLQDR